MVPVKSAADMLIEDAYAALVRCVQETVRSDELCAALCGWLGIGTVAPKSAKELASRAVAKIAVSKSHVEAAILGYAIASGVKDAAVVGCFRSTVEWLCGRGLRTGRDPAPFCADAVSLLGITCGARSCDDAQLLTKTAAWLAKCVEVGQTMVESWEAILMMAASSQCGNQAQVLSAIPVADVILALRAKGCLTSNEAAAEEEERNTLLLMKSNERTPNAFRAAFRLKAYEWTTRAAPVVDLHRPSVDAVCEVLRRVPSGLNRWVWEDKPRTPRKDGVCQKWGIDNEYHVQSLLWAILAPVFPDLISEENLPSVGPKKPRADLCLPGLKTIIEVKFWYTDDKSRRIVDEVAADASLYLAEGSNYKEIIAFVWDDGRRTEQYDELCKGLKALKGVRDAIIVPRPSMMK